MGVSNNGGTSKSSIYLIGFSLVNQPFGGTPIDGNLRLCPFERLEVATLMC